MSEGSQLGTDSKVIEGFDFDGGPSCKSKFADILVIGGVILGNLAWLLDLMYTSQSYWGMHVLKILSILFMVA